ncbi:MAG TPA: hypothetical protein VF528_05185 [Pyrinomonadaceae bacterium]
MALVPLPYRLAGYGAYNLCFDKFLGRKRSNMADPDFFATLYNNGFRKINFVKVICFRWAKNESLPADRAIPLYNTSRQINPAFLDNLVTLVERANQSRFWVQVCIFHQQAISMPNGAPGGNPEVPENLPPELMPNVQDALCTRLKKFFNPRPANPAQLALQKDLVITIVNRLKNYTNVLYEIGNELRMDGNGCTVNDNCLLSEWMNIMGRQILNILGQTNSIGTSTGAYQDPPLVAKNNEVPVFKGCGLKRFSPGYFDFHHGQWYSPDDIEDGIAYAKLRADAYKERPTPLIINDDGAPEELRRTQMETWATTAFSKGLHYSTKQTYPNGGVDENGKVLDFNLDALTKLNNAARI